MPNEIRYHGERAIAGRPLVWRCSGRERKALPPREDLAPGLPAWFDWGPLASRPAAVRLALAILADALRDRAHGDQLALRYCRELEEETITRFSDGWFEIGAWAVTRWISEQLDTRQATREAV